ncbi:MAG: polysaccharide deacetylase family protein [Polyangia bacterium]
MASSGLLASLSLDLDNQWSYMRTHGDAGWEAYPSYLHTVLPLALSTVESVGLKMTVFLVGADAAMPQHHELFRSISERGHEVGNHSLHHLQWLHKLPHAELAHEIVEADRLISEATGQKPRGFRGPGFACSTTLLRILAQNGYDYDCSTFPTFVGPLARAYYFMSARKLSDQESDERKDLFGSVRDGFRPLSGYLWALDERDSQGRPLPDLLEIPVTTLPVLRTPIHMSYLLFLAQRSPFVMRRYLDTAIQLCKLRSVEPSFLLHPLDFISGKECDALRFFPAMNMPSSQKRDLLVEVLEKLAQHFRVVPMSEHTLALRSRNLPRQKPNLSA